MTALLAAIAADLDVRPRDLVAETGRALIAAPFAFGGLVALLVLLAAVSA